MRRKTFALWAALLALAPALTAATLTVTTANSTGNGSLQAALASVQAGDTIAFNIPGTGPHVIATPPGGYELISKNNVTIDGYTQPGSSPNTAGILEANTAQIKIVLDSRNGNAKLLDFPGDNPNDATGYGDTESCVLGVYAATNAVIRGLSILAVPTINDTIAVYGVSFAKGGQGRVSGCWIGVHPDGTTLGGPADGITGFRFRHRDENNTVLDQILISDIVVGVPKGAATPQAEFNVFCGIPAIPIIIEGENLRFCGNFFNVFPNGMQDYNPAIAGLTGTFEGNIEVGRAGNNTLIGVDGDGVNDIHERNVFSGVVPESQGGYDHNVEFYGQTPGTNVVVAGNYFGVAIDGATRFTNGVPALNAAGGTADYRFGSNLDGVSDDIEANRVANNWPPDLFPPSDFGTRPESLNFFDELSASASVNARGNILINNFPYPASPLKSAGQFYIDYYAKALVDSSAGVVPTISSQSTGLRLKGTIPVANAEYPVTIVDVYVADPEGIQTGIDAGIPEMPSGFVQGRRYVASFVAGSAADLDSAPDKFEFDIRGLGGGNLTVTANYSKDPAGTPKARILTSPFSLPQAIPFVPGDAASAGLARVVPDKVVFDNDTANLNNWEPYAGVLGNSVFLVEANTFADDGAFSNQRYGLVFQPVAGGAPAFGEGFFADNRTAYKAQINLSRQDGNPGRVTGDRRPGAVNFMVGAEASPHGFAPFQTGNRWNPGYIRTTAAGQEIRYGTVQSFKLDTASLAQTSLSLAQDSANGRLTSGQAASDQNTRFGGDVVCLDNGNFVSVVEDRSRVLNPDGNCATATIFSPDGKVVKESFKVANGDLWSNVASYQGGFCVRVSGILYLFDNAGTPAGTIEQASSGGDFDAGRGDGTRIAAHINSPYVFLAGRARSSQIIRLAAFDTRNRTLVAMTEVSEPGLLDASSDRVNLACDALNRAAVAYETKVSAQQEQNQTLLRVFELKPAARQIVPLTSSFFAFANYGDTGFRTIRPTVAMTTKQILVAAKGEINKANNVAAGPDSLSQTTFYTVIAHPNPQDDPTPPVGGGVAPTLTVTRSGNNLTVTSNPQPLPAGWVLEVAPVISGPWTVLPGIGTPGTVPIGTEPAVFLRAHKP